MKSDFDNIYSLYSACKTEWEQNRSRWVDISRFVGISVDTNYMRNMATPTKGRDTDIYVDDPTAALSVFQSGDYMSGIMWGTGDGVFDIVPSRYVTEMVSAEEVQEYFAFATEQALYHMNHHDAGLSGAMKSYAYDQMAFGTSGVGCFLNKSFLDGCSHNALLFSNYGVDNLVIDEGKGGQCDIVFVVYNWKINRIIGEFCHEEGDIEKLPKIMRDAFKAKDFNRVFKIVFGFYPREDYHPALKGKRGAKYKGVWFLDDTHDNKTFYEEDFIERPIAVARAIKIRGESYGRAPGTMLNSTIKGVNFMIGTSIEIVERMSKPPLGIYGNALFGDSVLDTSPDGLTVFNQSMQTGSGQPVFPFFDVGDPSAILQFLVPYMNEKIVSGFKIDALLDFSSAKEMTATESLQRYAIRGKSLAGMLLQQKNEMLTPIAMRSITLLMGIGQLGVDPTDKERVKALKSIGEDKRIIPDAIINAMKAGKPWFDLRWNNELEKLTRTEAIQNLVQLLQSISAIAMMYPDIIQAIDWYKLLKDINDNLDANNQIVIPANEFKKRLMEAAEQRNQMMALQAGQVGSQAVANVAKANKDNKEAQNNGK